MIDYTLAKELKDAGFPRHITGGSHFVKENGVEYIRDNEGYYEPVNSFEPLRDEEETAYIPTLPELMGALPSRKKYIDGLINDAQCVLLKTVGSDGEWYVAYLNGDWESHEDEDKWRFESKTPEEAVARLWLALNKK